MSVIELKGTIKPKEIGDETMKNKVIGAQSIRYKIYRKLY
jgi:hypothetical protein